MEKSQEYIGVDMNSLTKVDAIKKRKIDISDKQNIETHNSCTLITKASRKQNEESVSSEEGMYLSGNDQIYCVSKVVYSNDILNNNKLIYKAYNLFGVDAINLLFELGEDQDIAEQILLVAEEIGTEKVLKIFFGDEVKPSNSEASQIEKQELTIKTQDEQILAIITKIEAVIGKEALAELTGWHKYFLKALSNNPFSSSATKIIQAIGNLVSNLEEWLNFGAAYEDIDIDNQVAIIISQLEHMFDFVASGITHVGLPPRYPHFDPDDYYGGGSGGNSGNDLYNIEGENNNIDFSSLFVGQNTTNTYDL
jgi:hypothetical protein